MFCISLLSVLAKEPVSIPVRRASEKKKGSSVKKEFSRIKKNRDIEMS
jgi:hypothetical protein